MDTTNPFDDSMFPEFSINNLNASNATSVITSSKSLCENDNRNHSIQVMLNLQQDMIFNISPNDHRLDEHHLPHHADDINNLFNSSSSSVANSVITTQAIKPAPISPITTTTSASQSSAVAAMPQHLQQTCKSNESVTTTTFDDKLKPEVDTTCNNIQTSGNTQTYLISEISFEVFNKFLLISVIVSESNSGTKKNDNKSKKNDAPGGIKKKKTRLAFYLYLRMFFI